MCPKRLKTVQLHKKVVKLPRNKEEPQKTRGKRANSSQTHAVCSILMAVLSQDGAVKKYVIEKDGTKSISWAA